MALLFSAVTVTAGNDETDFLVGGIPKEYDDLEGWSFFDNFIENIREETDVAVHTESYLYGEGETVTAIPEEIAYFMKRMEADDRFLPDHCSHIENADFTIQWSPEELYGMEME